ncbi:MAG: hypothetical protein ACAH80_16550 [Alphaproteobacteria bacterium]
MQAEAATATTLLPLVARLQGRKLVRIEGSDIFGVPAGWAADAVAGEPEVKTVRTPLELEEAMQDEGTSALFVPRYTFGWSMLERILRRNSLVKTIFWEE